MTSTGLSVLRAPSPSPSAGPGGRRPYPAPKRPAVRSPWAAVGGFGWEQLGKILGKLGKNPGKTWKKSWENLGKIMGKWRLMSI